MRGSLARQDARWGCVLSLFIVHTLYIELNASRMKFSLHALTGIAHVET